jgi:hypothetical protein
MTKSLADVNLLDSAKLRTTLMGIPAPVGLTL